MKGIIVCNNKVLHIIDMHSGNYPDCLPRIGEWIVIGTKSTKRYKVINVIHSFSTRTEVIIEVEYSKCFDNFDKERKIER